MCEHMHRGGLWKTKTALTPATLQCCVDLKAGVLRFGSTEAQLPFLPEHEIPQGEPERNPMGGLSASNNAGVCICAGINKVCQASADAVAGALRLNRAETGGAAHLKGFLPLHALAKVLYRPTPLCIVVWRSRMLIFPLLHRAESHHGCQCAAGNSKPCSRDPSVRTTRRCGPDPACADRGASWVGGKGVETGGAGILKGAEPGCPQIRPGKRGRCCIHPVHLIGLRNVGGRAPFSAPLNPAACWAVPASSIDVCTSLRPGTLSVTNEAGDTIFQGWWR